MGQNARPTLAYGGTLQLINSSLRSEGMSCKLYYGCVYTKSDPAMKGLCDDCVTAGSCVITTTGH